MMTASFEQGGTLLWVASRSFDFHRSSFLKGAFVRPFYLSQIRHVTTRNNMRSDVTGCNRG